MALCWSKEQVMSCSGLARSASMMMPVEHYAGGQPLSHERVRAGYSPRAARQCGSRACRDGDDRAAPVSNLYRRTEQRTEWLLRFSRHGC